MTKTSVNPGYMPQLDGLRAYAAFGVLVSHFAVNQDGLLNSLHLGDLGVRLFFVLSGFLITGILLRVKDRLNEGTLTWHGAFGNFYMRRFLRLIPVYYATLVVAGMTYVPLREHLPWFTAYLQNIHFAIEGEFTFGDHLWTLAVEEQFYLVWPLLIFLIPYRYLFTVLIFTIVLGPVTRVLLIIVGLTHFQASMLTPCHFDTFALGALFAFIEHRCLFPEPGVQRFLHIGALGGFLGLGTVFIFKKLGFPSFVEFFLSELAAAFLFSWVVVAAARGLSGWMRFILGNPVAMYVGRISYGLYVYHVFLPSIYLWMFGDPPVFIAANDLLHIAFFSVPSVALAALSFHLMETPVSRLKSLFQYADSTRLWGLALPHWKANDQR